MNDQEYGLKQELHTPATLYEAYGTFRRAKRPFSLLSVDELSESGVQEWISSRKSQRVITFRADSKADHVHDYLEERGICVIPKKLYRKDVVLEVPEGTKSMRTVANFIERDPDSYSVLFQLMGSQLRDIHDNTNSVPSGNWLDQFAYYPDVSSKEGGRVVILPPYSIGHDGSDVASTIYGQLSATNKLKESTVTQLIWEVQHGWNGAE